MGVQMYVHKYARQMAEDILNKISIIRHITNPLNQLRWINKYLLYLPKILSSCFLKPPPAEQCPMSPNTTETSISCQLDNGENFMYNTYHTRTV